MKRDLSPQTDFNASTSAQTINAATNALIAASSLAVPVDKLRVGAVFRFRFQISKTAAGTASISFSIRIGTLGTVADAAVLTFALPVGTAVADDAVVEIEMTVRAVGASAVVQGTLTLIHNLASTGFATVPCVVLKATSAAFNSTTANLIVSASCLTAAATVLTFNQVSVKAENL
jgi:hypothetical protein